MSIRFIALFFWVLTINISVVGYKLNLSLLTLLIVSALSLLDKKMDRTFFNIIMFVAFIFLYILLIFLINDATSIYILNIIFLSFLYIFSFSFIFKRYKPSTDKLVLHFIYIVTFNSIIVLISAYNINLIDFIYNFIYLTDKQFSYSLGEKNFLGRYSGINSSGFSFLSVLNFFAVYFILYCFATKKFIERNKYLVLCLIINLVATIWIGRSGLFLSLFYIIAYMFISSFYKTLLFSLIFGFAAYIFISPYLYIFDIPTFTRLLIFSEDAAIFDLISNEYTFYHINIYDYLFGSSINLTSSNSLPSDVGLVNIFNLFGLFGIFILLGNNFYFWILKYRNYKEAFLLYSFPFLAIFLNMKDTYLFSYTPLFKAFLILIVFKIYEYKKSKNFSHHPTL